MAIFAHKTKLPTPSMEKLAEAFFGHIIKADEERKILQKYERKLQHGDVAAGVADPDQWFEQYTALKSEKKLEKQQKKRRRHSSKAYHGQIHLLPTNGSGFGAQNVKLWPLPRTWGFENVRDLLTRAKAPCPLAWSIDANRRFVHLEYAEVLHQIETIQKLDGIPIEVGVVIHAAPVEVQAATHELDRGGVVDGEGATRKRQRNEDEREKQKTAKKSRKEEKKGREGKATAEGAAKAGMDSDEEAVDAFA